MGDSEHNVTENNQTEKPSVESSETKQCSTKDSAKGCGCGCSSRCNPCMFIWGGVLIAFLIYTATAFLR